MEHVTLLYTNGILICMAFTVLGTTGYYYFECWTLLKLPKVWLVFVGAQKHFLFFLFFLFLVIIIGLSNCHPNHKYKKHYLFCFGVVHLKVCTSYHLHVNFTEDKDLQNSLILYPLGKKARKQKQKYVNQSRGGDL